MLTRQVSREKEEAWMGLSIEILKVEIRIRLSSKRN